MGMRIAAALFLALAALPAAAETDPLPAPESWRKESFTFPLQFAPSIPYQGEEHVRFTPSWARFGEENGFSYVFLWNLKARPVTPEDVEEYLEAYFNGLMSNVGRQRNVADKEVKATVAVHPMALLEGWGQGYGVEVRTWNAFSRGQPLLLRGEIGQRYCGERMQIFFAFSQAQRDRPIWDGLRAARKATSCDKSGS
ncbi:MAG: hypothetical protein ABI789_05900 [Usitatibacter sp.]